MAEPSVSIAEEKLRLEILRIVGGDVMRAREALAFVTGESDQSPEAPASPGGEAS